MIAQIWEECRACLKDELPQHQFNTWIRPLKASAQDTKLVLEAPNRFISNWVRDRFLLRIQKFVSKNFDTVTDVTLFSDQVKRRDRVQAAPVVLNVPSVQAPVESAAIPEAHPLLHHASNRPVFDLLKKKNTTHKRSEAVQKSYLNNQFSFESFVQGNSNQLAYASATQVADNLGNTYNPLFIYGGVGLGKTHLMHAVGNSVEKRFNARVMYLHSERFVADMIKALQMKSIGEFKRYYRGFDALLIDDIQFFSGKQRSQEEFLHTLNALLEDKKQIIVTCDRFPKDLVGIEERLKSRLGSGLIVEVEPPNLETRAAILTKKASQQFSVSISKEAIYFIAKKIRSNVRELEGALRRVVANAEFTGSPITLSFIQESLKDLLASHEKRVSIENIQKAVAEYYSIKVSQLLSKSRMRSVIRPRQIAMALSRELTDRSFTEIGRAFGGRDHTTILYARKRVQFFRETDSGTSRDYDQLLQLLTF